jgi:hypothetical protein
MSVLGSEDKKFVKKIKSTIENETYDNLDIDEWEIIETLLEIIEVYTKEK